MTGGGRGARSATPGYVLVLVEVVGGDGAAFGEGGGVAADELEGVVGVFDGEVLGLDGQDGVDVGEVVDDDAAGFSFSDFLAGDGVDDSNSRPGRALVDVAEAGGVELAAELGHAVFVDDVLGWDAEFGLEPGVEFWLCYGVLGAFVAAGFEQPGWGLLGKCLLRVPRRPRRERNGLRGC